MGAQPFGALGSSTASSAAPGTGFSFGAAPAAAPATTGFSFGGATAAPASAPSNQFFSTSVPAQTSTGMPYPKETKFADLPNDVRTAIEALETTIRGYEQASFQVADRRYEQAESSAGLIEQVEKVPRQPPEPA